MRFYFRALSYFRQDVPLIVTSVVLIAISTLSGLLQPFLMAILLDTILSSTPSRYWVNRAFMNLARSLGIASTDTAKLIITLAALAVCLRVLQEVLAAAQRLLNAHIGYNGLMRVRCALFRKLQELSLAYHKSQPQGDAIYRLSYDTGGFQTILTVAINNIVVSAVTLVLMTWIMLQMNWQLTLITLSVAPVLLWVTKLFAEPLKRRWLEAKQVDTELTTVIQRSVASIGLVQAFGRESDEFGRFHDTAQNSVRANLRQIWQESWYWLLVGTIFGVGYALIFGYGGWAVYRHALSIGSLFVFLDYVNRAYGPLQSLSSSGASIQGGVAGVQRVFEVLDRDAVIKDAPNAIALPRQPRVLKMNGVSFEYRPGQPVLRDIDVTISPGQMVAFVGSSGVGKTTLLNLLPRFYDPTSGQMLLDGLDIRNVRLKDLRAHVALVLQDNVILPTTVAENIAYGRPGASTAQIRHAAELAGAAVFIEKFSQGYETVISESGGNISGGQRQRIGIARALLTEAPFMVFDEPTSALDAQHEAMFVQTLRSLKRQRTIILVSHRLSTVLDCDEIFVMDEGRIVQRGSHDQLLTQRGPYSSLARQQLKLETAPGNLIMPIRPHQKLRIIVGGLVGQFPLGGVAWDYFHYVLALHELGHDVYYYEDTWVWPFDPIKLSPVDNPDYSVRFLGEFFQRYAPHLSDRWHYVMLHEKPFGMTREAFGEIARTADIFLNVSGACIFPDNLNSRCLKIFLDTDPGYNQIMLREKFAWSENVDRWCKMVADHDRHFTYAENIHDPASVIPRMNFDWKTTRCVVTLPQWSAVRNSPIPADAPMTTVMTWDWFKGPLIHNGVQYGTKVPEYEKFHDLPKRTDVPLALVIGSVKAPLEKIQRDGWRTLDAYEVTLTPQKYQNLIGNSAGEWSVAKNVYVATRSGWFSCRTACYLAAGRPAVVQDTAWSKFIPSGNGLIAFDTMDQALAGLAAVSANPAAHRAAAYEIARNYLAPDRVLPQMIDAIYDAT